jgi:hypothetical protein
MGISVRLTARWNAPRVAFVVAPDGLERQFVTQSRSAEVQGAGAAVIEGVVAPAFVTPDAPFGQWLLH